MHEGTPRSNAHPKAASKGNAFSRPDITAEDVTINPMRGDWQKPEFNVYPNQIEEHVIHLDGVTECACIGIDDEKSGAVPKLFVGKILRRKLRIEQTDYDKTGGDQDRRECLHH